MNLDRAIRYLRTEAERLDRAIESLERLLSDPGSSVPPEARYRGRKSMSTQERAEVSARMKRYWAQRKRAK